MKSGTERISISFSGLDQSEACWVRRLARALGKHHNAPLQFIHNLRAYTKLSRYEHLPKFLPSHDTPAVSFAEWGQV